MALLQLSGAFGPVYVRSYDIVALAGAYGPSTATFGQPLRDLYVRGAGEVIQILDTSDNVAAVLATLDQSTEREP